MPNFKDAPVEPITAGAQAQGQPQEQGQPVDPNDPKLKEIMHKAKNYETVLINIIHSDKTRDAVIDLLKSNKDPLIVMPEAISTINDMGVQAMKRGGIDVEVGVQLVGSQFILDDLVQLATASKSLEVTEEDLPAILEDTYQMYVEKGFKDKTIDPIQLQLEVQKIMTPEQAIAGIAMNDGSVPQNPNKQAVALGNEQKIAHTARQDERAKVAKKGAVEKQTALQGQMVQQAQGGE